MKIFIVCPRLCHGGAERVGATLANGFANRGHEVFMISDLYEEVTFHLAENVKLLNLTAPSKNTYIKWLHAIRILRAYVKNEKPNVIIGIMELCSFVSKVACIGYNIPIIATEHNSFERPSSAPMGKKSFFMKYFVNKIYDKVTVLTDADRVLTQSHLRNVQVMPNPLCLPSLTTIPVKKNIVLAVGRIDNWHCKGFDVLLDAWGKIAKRYPNWKLQIVGPCRQISNKKYLLEIGAKWNCSNQIEILNFESDIQKVYEKASVFVLSSRYEGFGLVLIEAMSQGCACIACDYKGRQQEILQNSKNGVLCEPDNIDALSESITKVLENASYRSRIQNNAIVRSKYYSLENTMDRWEKLLSQTIKNDK